MSPSYNYPNPYLVRPTPNYPTYNEGILWVQGIEGAKAYQMNPNQILQLMDSENDGIFYIKSTDNIGMATLRVFRYVEITANDLKPQPQNADLSEYVKRTELADLIKGILTEVKDEPIVQSVAQSNSKSTSKPKGLISD